MTMEELRSKVNDWYEHLNGRELTDEDINDFCNMNATNYEEYMILWELMTDAFPTQD